MAGAQIQPCLPPILHPSLLPSAARVVWGACRDPRLRALGPLPSTHWAVVDMVKLKRFFPLISRVPPDSHQTALQADAGHVGASQGALYRWFVYFYTQFGNICSDIFRGSRQEENKVDISQVLVPSRIGNWKAKWFLLPLHFIVNISFEREGSIIVPRGYIICKQVPIKGKSPK